MFGTNRLQQVKEYQGMILRIFAAAGEARGD